MSALMTLPPLVAAVIAVAVIAILVVGWAALRSRRQKPAPAPMPIPNMFAPPPPAAAVDSGPAPRFGRRSAAAEDMSVFEVAEPPQAEVAAPAAHQEIAAPAAHQEIAAPAAHEEIAAPTADEEIVTPTADEEIAAPAMDAAEAEAESPAPVPASLPVPPAEDVPSFASPVEAAPAAAPAAGAAVEVRGFVERVTRYEVGGWAYCPERPDAHLTIEVLRNGRVVSRSMADQYRPDLHLSGIGGGDHAFVARVAAGDAAGADVVAVTAGGQRTSLIWLAQAADDASVDAGRDSAAGEAAP